MPAVADPAKELRFTRARQAVVFWLGAAVLAVAEAWPGRRSGEGDR